MPTAKGSSRENGYVCAKVFVVIMVSCIEFWSVSENSGNQMINELRAEGKKGKEPIEVIFGDRRISIFC